jgi:hypothetical protein
MTPAREYRHYHNRTWTEQNRLDHRATCRINLWNYALLAIVILGIIATLAI